MIIVLRVVAVLAIISGFGAISVAASDIQLILAALLIMPAFVVLGLAEVVAALDRNNRGVREDSYRSQATLDRLVAIGELAASAPVREYRYNGPD